MASGQLTTRFDLPAGAGRLYAEGTGISHLVVDGVIVTVDGAFTGATPGRVLRSGIDTDTPDVMPPRMRKRGGRGAAAVATMARWCDPRPG